MSPPPTYIDVYSNLISRAKDIHIPGTDGASAADLVESFRNVQTGLLRELGLSSEGVSAIFLDNTRHRINYLRDILVDVIRNALRNENEVVSPEELIRRILQQIEELSLSKSYRLVDMLLYSLNSRFANFIKITGIERWLRGDQSDGRLLREVLDDYDYGSGYVGNIFNYHIPYRAPKDLSFFLEKIRILDFLSNYRTNTQLD